MKYFKQIFSGIFGLKFKLDYFLLIILPILFLALSMMEYFKVFKFDIGFRCVFSKDEYFWFFSTAAQAMAALFGIGGMFAAFVLQLINNKYDDYLERARMASIAWDERFRWYGDEEFLNKLDEHLRVEEENGTPDLPSLTRMKKSREYLVKYKKKKDEIKKAFKDVIVLMASVILLSLLALLISYILSLTTFGLIFGIFFLILIMVTILKLARFIFVSIKD